MAIFEALIAGLLGWRAPSYEHHPRPHRDTVNLKRVSVTYSGLAAETDHTVHRDQLQRFCDESAEAEGVQEVTIFEEIFHHKHESDPAIGEALAPGAIVAFSMTRSKAI